MLNYLLEKITYRQGLTIAAVLSAVAGFSGQPEAGTASDVTVIEGSNGVISYNLGYTAPAGGIEVQVMTNLPQLQGLTILL